jgi:hypothetical protein
MEIKIEIKVGDRVSFRDLAGRIVWDTVVGLVPKVISYAAYDENHPVCVPMLLLTEYTWMRVDEVISVDQSAPSATAPRKSTRSYTS